MIKKIVGIALLGTAILTSVCSDNPVTPEKEAATAENVLGKWYCKVTDTATGFTFILYLDNGTDSATIGILNGSREVELLRFAYSVSNGSYTFVAPTVDTANQNAIQILFAGEMSSMFYSSEVYLLDGDLCFDDGGEVYTFTRSIPTIAGGSISGSLSVINGTFGQGMAMVVAADINTGATQGTFLDMAGEYSVRGLVDGSYYLMAVYIPKEHAADFMNYSITDFPYTMLYSPITISSGNHVTGRDITIDLSTAPLPKQVSSPGVDCSAVCVRFLHAAGSMFRPQP